MKNIDYSIYYVTDCDLLHPNYDLFKSVEESIIGGATLIQLREKNESTKEFYNKALKLKEICKKYEVPLIINDRIDVALAIDADGIHIGQDDMPLDVARKILGDKKIIGVSCHNLEEALKAEKEKATYLGVGAMYSTNTKKDTDMTSMEEMEKIKNSVNIPIVVIGGINQKTIPDFKDKKIDGLAIVSAISSSENQIVTTKKLKNLFNNNTKIQACIFDIDGTLIDSMNIWDNTIKKISKKYGFEYTKNDLQCIWNMNFEDASKYTVNKFNLKISPKNYFKELIRLSVEEYENSEIILKNGVKEYLDFLKSKNVRLAICTSLTKNQYETVLKKVGLKNYFEDIFSSTDMNIDKSNELLYENISKKMKINPTSFLVFDDDVNAYYGIKNAKMRFCLLKNNKFMLDNKIESKTDYIIEDFNDDCLYNIYF